VYVALAKFDVFSNISVFYPLTSRAAPAYPLPPPTTLVGALAYPYLRSKCSSEYYNGYSPAVKLLDVVYYASAGAYAYHITKDVERIYQHVYLKKPHWRKLEMAFTVSVRGLATYLENELFVLYVSKDRKVLDYVYGITRIGRKECHVALRDIVIEKLENVISHHRVFNTIFYTPTAIAECTRAIKISMPKLDRRNFSSTTQPLLDEYFVPNGLEPMECELGPRGLLVEINGLSIAIPRL